MKKRQNGPASGYNIKRSSFKIMLNKKRKLFIFVIAAVAIVVAVVIVISSNAASANALNAKNAEGVTAAETESSPEVSPTSDATETAAEMLPDESAAYQTLQAGDDNSQVQLLQTRLMDLGYMSFDEPTNLFATGTEYAVELFQRQHSLDQDGIATPDLLELLYSDQAKPYTLLEGTSGTDVDSLQRRLIDLGYMDKATGYYGTETIEAVKAFQDENGLYVDGKTGAFTLDLIYSPNAQQSPMKATEAARRANILEMLDIAEEQLGKPYVWGAEGPSSFDCSGLVYYCLKEAGSSRGRYNAAGYSQVSDWEKITSMDDLEKGDLLFFSTNGKSVGHTGIYIGDGLMIDASSANGEVVERACKTGFWESNFVVARRPW